MSLLNRKEVIDLRLTRPQVFIIFFGCLLGSVGVFTVGVSMGKRLRNLELAPLLTGQNTIETLDRLLRDQQKVAKAKGPADVQEEDATQLTFHAALTQNENTTGAKASEADDIPPLVAPKATAAAAAKAPVAGAAAPTEKSTAAEDASDPVLARSGARARLSPANPGPAATTPAVTSAPAARARGFTLQISSYGKKKQADRVLRKLKKHGHEPYVTEAQIPGRGRVFRVRLGQFQTQDEADAARQMLRREEKLTAMVTPL